MTQFVIDASAVLALVLKENLPRVNLFFEALEPADQLLGPRLLLAECTSVIHEQAAMKRLPMEDVPGYVEDLVALRIELADNPDQFRNAVRFAREMGRVKAYDTQYLGAAVAEGVELVTVDSGMRQAAVNIKHPVRYLR